MESRRFYRSNRLRLIDLRSGRPRLERPIVPGKPSPLRRVVSPESDQFPMDVSVQTLMLALGLLAVLAAAQAVTWLAFGWSVRRQHLQNSQLERQRVFDLIGRLHGLATGMACQVEQQLSRVDSLNHDLTLFQATAVNANGADDPVLGLVERTVDANQSLRQELASAEARLQEQAGQIEQYMAAAHTDVLTGLANRRAFDNELQRRIAEHVRHGTPVNVLLIDVDHFKRFNDRHGHLAGDRVLRGVARVLLSTFSENDVVARYGGEEFAVLLSGVQMAQASLVAERSRQAIAQQPFRLGEEDFSVTVSLGLASIRPDEAPSTLIERADSALYASKQAGRNRTHAHDGQTPVLIGGARPAAAPLDVVSPTANAAELAMQGPDLTQLCSELRQRVADVVGLE